MRKEQSSRRDFVQHLGLGVAAGAVAVATTNPAAAGVGTLVSESANFDQHDWLERAKVIFESGSIRGFRVSKIHPVKHGAMRLELTKESDGDSFDVKVCAADATGRSASPVAATPKLALYLANEGGGSTATRELHGLVTMDLAHVMDLKEKELGLASLPLDSHYTHLQLLLRGLSPT